MNADDAARRLAAELREGARQSSTEPDLRPPPLAAPAEFPMPTAADRVAARDARRTEFLSRARSVRADGWDDYLFTWSTGEAVGVALLLEDDAALSELDETRDSALSRWAYELFSMVEARTDAEHNYPVTRAWFQQTRAVLIEGL
ncbi:hypothetical protein [Nocardia sp. NPDC060249]|uniref:hypothetical protein n=1 Tax=Nocardia sp. NPDC060249 TaxID=3347082 RepID=UPI00365CAA68